MTLTKEKLIQDFIKKFDEEYPSVRSYTAGQLEELLENLLSDTIDKVLEELTIEKKGKHDSKCEHDNNWCVTHAEELIDDEYEEYGFNQAVDQLNTLKEQIKKEI